MILQYFDLIKQRIQQAAPDIDKIELQANQMDDNDMLAESCLFVSFGGFDWQTLPIKQQVATLQIEMQIFHHVIGSASDASSIEPHLRAGEAVYKAMQGWHGKLSDLPQFAQLAGTNQDFILINELTRTYQQYFNVLPYCHTIMRFYAVVFDISAMPTYQNILANLNLSTSYDN